MIHYVLSFFIGAMALAGTPLEVELKDGTEIGRAHV